MTETDVARLRALDELASPQDKASAPRSLLAIVVALLRARRNRREVAALDDRQLRDAGIDPVEAGRGRAAAIDPLKAVTLTGMGYQ